MAKARYIHTTFWSDEFIGHLQPLDAYLFLYFLTNPHTNICGIYQVSMRDIMHETKLTQPRIEGAIHLFEESKKIYYLDGWIYIKNFSKHQARNENVSKGIKNAMDEVPKPIIERIDSLSIATQLSLSESLSESKLNSPQTANFKQNYLKKLKSRNSKSSSSLQVLSAEIVEWGGGRLSMGQLMKLGKTKGEQYLRECWATAKDSKVRDPVAYFFSLYGKIKIKNN